MINRCVCFGITFQKLKDIAKEKNCKSVDELKQHVVFSDKCKLCLPYVEAMLKTGETVFIL